MKLSSHPLVASLFHQSLIIGITTVVFTAGFSLGFAQPVGPTLLYCLCITVCCSTLVQLVSAAVRTVWSSAASFAWPRMVLILLVCAPVGYELGTWIADALLGTHTASLLQVGPRTLLFLLFIMLLPGLAISYYFVTQQRLADARSLAAEHQLRLLQAQLEPHMLFNTLANLRVLIGLDPIRAQGMLDQLISFLRATLNASRQGSHPLREEFSRLGDYLALMQVRMGDRLTPTFELPPELAEVPVPPMLLQPLVENAIKHGLEPAVDGGELRVTARRIDRIMTLEVADRGVGLQSTPSAGSSHFGLAQVRDRLAARYGTTATLAIEARPDGGTLATITLPLP